uniref:Putative secreted protein n=1 Tax=Anopheles marajoara TaxID=58244 RepID=A0A2M4CDU7_9DIPT
MLLGDIILTLLTSCCRSRLEATVIRSVSTCPVTHADACIKHKGILAAKCLNSLLHHFNSVNWVFLLVLVCR